MTTILVVDDLEPNVKLLEAKLLQEYYNVVVAYDGLQALERLKEHKVDVILLDIMMPGIDGFETCRRIKSDPQTKHIPVIMVTALSDIEDRVKGLEVGADEFLTKPVKDLELFTRVRSLSRLKNALDELKLRNQTNTNLGMDLTNLEDQYHHVSIVIIDDDIVNAKNITAGLAKLNSDKIQTNISLFSDPLDLKNLENLSPDLVMVSTQIEEEDPIRICLNLRNTTNLRYTSFLLMAQEEDTELVLKALDHGINDYIIAPFDNNELIARARTQINRKKYYDALRSSLEESVNMSIKDGLTKLYNRHYFDSHLKQLLNDNNVNKPNICIMLLDIDHFKNINDTYGHQAGDEILKNVADILQNSVRVFDLVARYGGEEFVIIINNITLEHANDSVAPRIMNHIREAEFKVNDDKSIVPVTLSIGITKYDDQTDNAESLIKRADEALYEAKETGRNKTCLR